MALVACSKCHKSVSDEFEDCPICGTPVSTSGGSKAKAVRLRSVPIVRFNESKVEFSVSTKAEARLAIKEIKLKKKEFQLRKRELRAQQKTLRSNYTHTSRTRSPLVRGRGAFSTFIRLGQSSLRSAARAELAHGLAPLEDEIQRIERRIVGLDSLVLRLESFIFQQRS